MEMRNLGGTGIEVSRFCFGAMMLGPWGSIDEILGTLSGRTLNPADSGWTPPALADPKLRRRR